MVNEPSVFELSRFDSICFLELSEEFPKDSKNEFESAMVNESSVFEAFRFYCISTNYIDREGPDRSVYPRSLVCIMALDPPSSIRAFALHLQNVCVLSIHIDYCQSDWLDRGCTKGLIEVFHFAYSPFLHMACDFMGGFRERFGGGTLTQNFIFMEKFGEMWWIWNAVFTQYSHPHFLP